MQISCTRALYGHMIVDFGHGPKCMRYLHTLDPLGMSFMNMAPLSILLTAANTDAQRRLLQTMAATDAQDHGFATPLPRNVEQNSQHETFQEF